MIYFKKVKWKNFLSTGNNFIEYQLDRNHTTLVIGENGSGKSTMLDALCFGLFNKPFRDIKKDQLINTINMGGTEVEVEFNIGKKEYVIRRGIKPSIFEIYCNDELVNQDATILDYQKYLEQNILKINYRSFTQVVILGSSSFVPFMQLKTAHRKEVVEDILDIKIFSTMNILAKQKQKELESEVKDLETEVEHLKDKISIQEKHIAEASKQQEDQIEEYRKQVEKNNEIITDFNAKIETIHNDIGNIRDTITDEDEVKKNLKKLESFETNIENKASKTKRDIKFYESKAECPTCKQDITFEYKEGMVHQCESKLKELTEALDKLSSRLASKQRRLEEITTEYEKIKLKDIEIAKYNQSITEINNFNTKMNHNIDKLTNAKNNVSEAQGELKVYNDNLQEKDAKKISTLEEMDYVNAAKQMLLDSGIKTKIIRMYLPIMNQLINKYLQSMDFFVNFKLDEEFNETIKSRFRDDFSYSSFSEGEKMRIDLALLFTWRAIAKMKNSVNTNLLILDEIFDSSLDISGTDDFLKIINTLSDNNVFIISHKTDILIDKFKNVIQVEKHKNFTRIS
jgi:DNA repair exonuclease SbcCD ATPase subunit|tara:strand:+ start:2636 stop:4345 length:1710 start_codon:yes stop_codon:yes gene_type:complete